MKKKLLVVIGVLSMASGAHLAIAAEKSYDCGLIRGLRISAEVNKYQPDSKLEIAVLSDKYDGRVARLRYLNRRLMDVMHGPQDKDVEDRLTGLQRELEMLLSTGHASKGPEEVKNLLDKNRDLTSIEDLIFERLLDAQIKACPSF